MKNNNNRDIEEETLKKNRRIDIRDIGEETLKKLDEQKEKYGLKSRVEYIKLLINLDILTNIVQKINKEGGKKNE